MNRRAHPVGLAAAVLHDVHLAAGRPSHGGDVLAEHPERRPQALSRRQFDPRLDPAVRGKDLPARGDLRRRVATGAVVTMHSGVLRDARDDLKLALTVLLNVRGVGGVVHTIVVPPPANTRTPVAAIVVP